MHKNMLAGLVGSAVLLGALSASAQDGSWLWPLYVRAEQGAQITTGEPRPAIWNSAGEFQSFTVKYMHPGHDIRGDHGDVALIPAAGTLERVYQYDDHCLKSGNSCRLWFQQAGGRFLYYVSHVDFSPTPQASDRRQVTTEMREVLQEAVAGTADPGKRTVTRGQQLATLTMFQGVPDGWHHLHVGVFDRQQQYRMANTISFFDLQATGATGASMYALDDEPPTISSLVLTADQDPNLVPATVDGSCGSEISGKVDAVAEIYDTYFTDGTFATFPGKGLLPPSTGIRAANVVVRNRAGQPVYNSDWFDIAGLPLVCSATATGQACLLSSDPQPELPAFFARMDNEQGGPSPGTTLLEQLFNVTKSQSNYSVADGEHYFHVLTNTQGQPGVWDPAGLPNGRYQVTATAQDFAFRGASRSMFVNYRAPGTSLGTAELGDIFVRDRDLDIGAVPSNAGGEPFWQSPDIFVVPEGTPVTETSLAVQSQVTAGAPYQVYVRVHNDTCQSVSGVKARILSANPAAINTNWLSITPGEDFVGPDASPGGVTVAPGSAALIGPFPWTPTPAEAAQDGHRCLLAGVSSASDTLSLGQLFDAPGQNNVGQRNLLVSGCEFQLPNPNATSTSVSLRLTTDAQVGSDSVVVLVAPHVQSWYDAWVGTPGVNVTTNGSQLRVRLLVQDLTLPAISLLGGSVAQLAFDISLPDGTGSRHASIEPSINGASVGGFSCYGVGDPIVK